MPPFTFTITADQLSNGLRPNEKMPRDSKHLIESKGAISKDGVLSAVSNLVRIDTSLLTDQFPFPQLFVFVNVILVCTRTKIYEWNDSSLVLKYTASTISGSWTAVDYFDYIYLSNGLEAVERNPESKVFALTTDIPHAVAACNFNGQLLIGGPDVDFIEDMLLTVSPITISLTPDGINRFDLM